MANSSPFLTGSQLEPEKTSHKGTWLTLAVAGLLLLIVLWVASSIISKETARNEAKKSYSTTKARCNHDPIVFTYHYGPSWEPYADSEISLGIDNPQPEQQYYCSVHEAVDDGHNVKEFDSPVPREMKLLDEIKHLYP